MAISGEDRARAGSRPARARPSSRPRPTWRPSSRTRRAARPASTCPATRAAPAPTRACAPRSAGPRWAPTSRRTSRASTSGPEPTPYQRAELLAAEAHGAARTFFLTNGATQGNHALCLALAPLGAAVVVQRNSHASVIDGLVLSGGAPTFVAPEYEDELGMAHGVTPGVARRRARAHAGRAGRVHRLADLLRHERRRRGLRRGLPRRRRAARRRPGVGPALRLPSRRCRRRR